MSESDERTYNEREMRELMRRATEKQRRSSEPDPSGLSLEEIKRIAAEVGVDPHFVELAAQDLGADSFESRANRFFGGTSQFTIKRRVKGALNGTSMAGIATAIRQHSRNDPGHIETFGTSMHWRTDSSNLKRVNLSVIQDGDDCIIESTFRLDQLGFLLNLPGGLIGLLALLALAKNGFIWAPAIILMLVAIVYTTTRFVFRGISESTQRSAERLIDNIERVVAAERKTDRESRSADTESLDQARETGDNLLVDADSYETLDALDADNKDQPTRNRDRS